MKFTLLSYAISTGIFPLIQLLFIGLTGTVIFCFIYSVH
jgi:hypothetical protein